MRWRDIEVARKPGGRPTLPLHGKPLNSPLVWRAVNIALSLTTHGRAGDGAGHPGKLIRSARLALQSESWHPLCPYPSLLCRQSPSSQTLLIGIGLSSYAALAAGTSPHSPVFGGAVLPLRVLAISIALLGLGAGGVLAYLRKQRLEPDRDETAWQRGLCCLNAIA